jgi:hypothetical protein
MLIGRMVGCAEFSPHKSGPDPVVDLGPHRSLSPLLCGENSAQPTIRPISI